MRVKVNIDKGVVLTGPVVNGFCENGVEVDLVDDEHRVGIGSNGRNVYAAWARRETITVADAIARGWLVVAAADEEPKKRSRRRGDAAGAVVENVDEAVAVPTAPETTESEE